MRNRYLITAPSVVVAITLGCTPSGPGDDVLLEGLPLFSLEEQRRFGDVESPELGFTRVTDLHVGPDGNLFVLEAAVPEIRVLSPQGELLRKIGRRGEGPGEFQATPLFGVLGDTVWAIDGRINRITLFDREGELISTGRTDGVQIPLPAGFGYILPRRMRPDGRFTGSFSRIASSMDDPPTGVEPTDRIPWPLVVFDASGAVADTIGWAGRPPPRMWRPPSEDNSSFEVVEIAGRRMIAPQPPTTTPWWVDLFDGYIVVATPVPTTEEEGAFTVTRFGVAEDTLYHRTFHFTPERYTEADLDSIAAGAARSSGGFVVFGDGATAPPPPSDALVRGIREMLDYPEFRLPIDSPFLADDETLWLRRTQYGGDTRRWVLLDPQGLPRGEVELPATLRLLWAKDDVLWGVLPDEFDVPWIVEYRLR